MNRLAASLWITRTELNHRCLAAVGGLLLILGICCAGCNGGTVAEAEERVDVQVYAVDARTHLCFSVLCWAGETRSSTWVPCTPEVLALAHVDRRGTPVDGGAK